MMYNHTVLTIVTFNYCSDACPMLTPDTKSLHIHLIYIYRIFPRNFPQIILISQCARILHDIK